MTRFCGKCGSMLNDTAVFCGGCGAKIPVAAAAPAQPGYTPATPDPASWATVPAVYAAPPPAPPVPATDATPPAITPDPATWATVAMPSLAPSSVNAAPAAWAPVSPAPVAPSPVNADPAAWAQVPASFTPAPAYTPPPAAYASAPAAYTPATAYPGKKSNTLLKVVIAVVVLICLGSALALAALYYAAQKVSQKAHQIAAQAMGASGATTAGGLSGLLGSSSNSSTSDDNGSGFKGDPCRFLSKTDVSQAVGITVIRTEAKDGGCSYIAKGDPADVTAKHMASMIGGMGADAQTQKTIQKFAGGLFAQQQASDKSLSAEAATGEIPVLGVGLSSGKAAMMEMNMNRGAFDHVRVTAPSGGGNGTAAQTATGDLTGIGDEAYVVGGSMLMVRKGNTVAQFTYISCPCNTDNIKPLAQKLASQL